MIDKLRKWLGLDLGRVQVVRIIAFSLAMLGTISIMILHQEPTLGVLALVVACCLLDLNR